VNYIRRVLGLTSLKRFSGKVLLGYLACIAAIVASIRPILSSHWYGDDWPNSQAPYWNLWRYGENSLERNLRSSWNSIQGWMYGQGRFYPFSILESNLLFSYLPNLQWYKLVQFGVILLVLVYSIWFLHVLSRSHLVSVSYGLCLAVVVQFRRDFDPHLGFSLLVPSMTLKLLIGSTLVYYATKPYSSRRSFLFCLGGSAFYFAAMSTYEHAFVLLGVPLAAVAIGYQHHRSLSRAVLAGTSILLTWLAYFWVVLVYLRAVVDGVIPRYQLQIGDNSLWIFVSQLISPLPMTVFESARDLQNNFQVFIAIVVSVGIAIVLENVIVANPRSAASQSVIRTKGFSNLGLLVIGVNLLLLPGLLLALRPLSFEASRFTGFQPELTYIHVFISELGAALLLSLVLAGVLSRLIEYRKIGSLRFLAVSYSLVLFFTVSHNYAVSRDTRFRELNYESWFAIHQEGYLFQDLRSGDGVITQTNNFAYETNPGNFYARSDKRLSGMFWLPYLYSETEITCIKNSSCEPTELRDRIKGQLVNSLLPDSMERSNLNAAGTLEIGDWVTLSLEPKNLAAMRLWVFDLYPVTSQSFIAFTAPLVSDELRISTDQVRFVMLSKLDDDSNYEILRPSLAGVCLLEDTTRSEVVGSPEYKLQKSIWRFPVPKMELRYLDMNFGTC